MLSLPVLRELNLYSGPSMTNRDDDCGERRLKRLIVRRTRLRTAGDRAFGAAARRLWNSLPADVVTYSRWQLSRND